MNLRLRQNLSKLFLIGSPCDLSFTGINDVLLDLIRSKGLEKINLDDLVEELLPKGRALVPTKIKEDLLGRIKNYLENDSDYKRLTGY